MYIIDDVLEARRVSYGKASTPIEDREYKCPEVGGSAVGSRKDWVRIATDLGFERVEFVELDGSKEVVNI
jgi:hypothetical protein